MSRRKLRVKTGRRGMLIISFTIALQQLVRPATTIFGQPTAKMQPVQVLAVSPSLTHLNWQNSLRLCLPREIVTHLELLNATVLGECIGSVLPKASLQDIIYISVWRKWSLLAQVYMLHILKAKASVVSGPNKREDAPHSGAIMN